MNLDNFKRDYKYKSGEGDNGNFKWLIIGVGIVIALLAYFLK